MIGNVWEWTASKYGSNAFKAGEHYDNPTGIEDGGSRVLRGGSWDLNIANYLQSAYRGYINPGSIGKDVGFRIVRTNP